MAFLPENADSLIGGVLKYDLVDDYGAVVIPANHIIRREDIARLRAHPFRSAPVVEVDFQRAFDHAIAELGNIFTAARVHGVVNVEHAKATLVPTIVAVSSHPSLRQLLRDLQVKDDYTLGHSVAVSVLSTLLGQWMGLSGSQLDALALAATLHDIGKIRVSEQILNKPGKLTPAEFAEVQRHTVYGFALLQATPGIPEPVALAALQHHERMNGGGYPNAARGEQISYFAKIIAVADVFHAMSSRRVYQDSKPIYMVLQELYESMFGLLDPVLTRTFIRRMLERLVGSDVRLSDGSTGTIVLIQGDDLLRPLLQIGENYVNLHDARQLNILEFV